MNENLSLSGRIASVGLLGLAFVAAGCGSGMEPMSALNQQGPVPALTLPIAELVVGSISSFSESGAATARDGFDIQANLASQNVLAPASGVVSFVDLTAGAGIVTIVHSLHLVTRLSGLQSVSVQAGALVQAGSGVGLSSATLLPFRFTVLYDNAVVCPLSFMTYAVQKFLPTKTATLCL